MTPFLKQVAQLYYQHYRNSLSDFGFVFPNRRAALFFRKYLGEIIEEPIFAPDVLPINDIFYQHSQFQSSDRITLLFELYHSFSLHDANHSTFDSFIQFGQLILDDFNDIDKYNVNAEQLFRNIEDLKEIDTVFDYLSDEQKEIIQQFWRHFLPKTDKSIQEHYLTTWRKMFAIYTSYREILSAKGCAYDGMIFRNVIERIQSGYTIDVPYKKIIFVGFNALNPTEKELLLYFKKAGKADFYFDYQSNLIQEDLELSGKYMKGNQLVFQSELELPQEISEPAQIEVIGVPSGVGQSKVIYQLLNKIYSPDEKQENTDFIESAIVLPNEKMMLPILHSIPEQIKTINITMGYPLSASPTSSLLDHIISLQKNIRRIDGKVSFYYKSVIAILQHPYIYQSCEEEAKKLIGMIKTQNQFHIEQQALHTHPLLSILFMPQETPVETIAYLYHIVETIRNLLSEKEQKELDKELLYHYQNALTRLDENIKNSRIELSLESFYRLLRMLTYGHSIPFKGEPLAGLQVMGVLEARTLDFENLIIPSFNDATFPKKSISNSIIPYNLRKHFGLPTYENIDAIHAYNFYRLIYRAKHVYFIYDSRSGSGGSEISRFYYQLKYLYGYQMQEASTSYAIKMSPKQAIRIDKTEDVQRVMESLLHPEGSTLSVSNINDYIDCSLRFYFAKIAKIKEDDTITEEIAANTFGSIFHKAMELILNRAKQEHGEHIDSTVISAILKNRHWIESAVQQAYASEYFKTKSGEVVPLKGYNKLIGEVIKKYVAKTLIYDQHNRVPFRMIANEYEINSTYPIKKGAINIKGYIDRVDSDGNTIFISDYKTGKGKLNVDSVEKLFDNTQDKRDIAIFQTMFYTLMMKKQSQKYQYEPLLYFITKLSPTAQSAVTIGGEKISSEAQEIMEHYTKLLDDTLEQMFNYSIPFTQTENETSCKYCNFAKICHP